MIKCAITGASGYVGSRLAAFLLNQGCQVYPMTRRETEGRLNDRRIPFELGRAPDPEEFRKRGIDALIHAAYDFTLTRRQDIETTNVAGSKQLLHAAQAGGVRTLLHISTLSAFPGCVSLYGRAKYATERHTLGLRGIVVRPGLVWGDQPGGMMGSLLKQLSQKRWIPAIAHPQKLLMLVHENDLSALVFRLLSQEFGIPDKPVLAASPTHWTLTDILKHLARREGKSISVIPVPWPLAWLGVKALESFGIQTGFRSDSIISLAYLNPRPGADALELPQIQFRDFRDR